MEEVVEMEYDRILNLGVQKIMEEKRNTFKFRNISRNQIQWSISITWCGNAPKEFKFSDKTNGVLEPNEDCGVGFVFFLSEIEMYKGEVVLHIRHTHNDETQEVKIPVFTGGKSNITIDPDKLDLTNKNQILENSDVTFKLRNKNPFKVVFCWVQGKDVEEDKRHLHHLMDQAESMI